MEGGYGVMAKGISFNVTLSEDQIEQIAKVTADKVRYSFEQEKKSYEFYEDELEIKERQLNELSRKFVEKEIIIDRWREIAKKWKKKAEEAIKYVEDSKR